jgi:hypothetical protein
MINPNFWHWISGLLAILPLWLLRNSPMPNNDIKLVYCGLAIAIPVLANIANELRDEFHFWAWLPYSWANHGDPMDVARCIPVAMLCCAVWWYVV